MGFSHQLTKSAGSYPFVVGSLTCTPDHEGKRVLKIKPDLSGASWDYKNNCGPGLMSLVDVSGRVKDLARL